MKPRWIPPAPGGSVIKEEFPPPPICPGAPNPAQERFLAAYLKRREKRSEYLRAYHAKHRKRILKQQAQYRAKKRAERSHYLCLLKHSAPLKTLLPAVATDKPQHNQHGERTYYSRPL